MRVPCALAGCARARQPTPAPPAATSASVTTRIRTMGLPSLLPSSHRIGVRSHIPTFAYEVPSTALVADTGCCTGSGSGLTFLHLLMTSPSQPWGQTPDVEM